MWEQQVLGDGHLPVTARTALHSRAWLEHCRLAGMGVRYRSARKSKWESQSIR